MEADKPKYGRPSKLTDEQKEDVRKRLLAGEKALHLAREYKVDEKVIRRLKSEPAKTDGITRVPVEQIKAAAEKSVANDLNDPVIRPLLEQMGNQDRDLFYNHKNDLLEISMSLNLSAKLSAQNAHKLAAMAQNHLNKVEIDAQLDGDSRKNIMDAMELQASSNECAKQPMKVFEIAVKVPPKVDPNAKREIVLVNAPDD